MKTKQIEKWLLLEQTGELTARQRRILNASPEAQAKRDELKVLCASVPAVDVEPSPWAVTKIAARLREERRPAWNFFLLRQGFGGQAKHWKFMKPKALPIFLTVACLTLVISTFDFNQTSPAPVVVMAAEVDVWNVQFEEDLVELESLILAISGDPLDMVEM